MSTDPRGVAPPGSDRPYVPGLPAGWDDTIPPYPSANTPSVVSTAHDPATTQHLTIIQRALDSISASPMTYGHTVTGPTIEATLRNLRKPLAWSGTTAPERITLELTCTSCLTRGSWTHDVPNGAEHPGHALARAQGWRRVPRVCAYNAGYVDPLAQPHTSPVYACSRECMERELRAMTDAMYGHDAHDAAPPHDPGHAAPAGVTRVRLGDLRSEG